MTKQWLSTILLMLLSSAANAQFSDTVHYHALLNATGSANHTDAGTTYMFNNAFRFGIKKEDVSLHANAGWVYGEQQQRQLTNNDFNGALDVNLYKTLPHFYYWGLLNYTSSYSLKINSQQQAALGIAYNILDTTDAYLNLSDGILYENSDIIRDDTVRETYTTFRNSFRLAFQFTFKKIITISSSTFWQPSLTYGNDYIIRSNSGLSVKLYRWLNLTTTLSYNKISRTEKENLLFSYGLSVEKYF